MRLDRMCVLVVVAAACVGFGGAARAAEEPKKDPRPVYVGAWSVDHELDLVTEECMEVLRTKKILFGSRSWGLTLGGYFRRQQLDPKSKYKIEWQSFARQRVNDEERVLTADLFNGPKIVNYIFDPAARRWRYMDDFLRKDPWKFAGKIDGCFQSLYYSGGREDMADYFPIVDGWVRDFPDLKVALFTHPVSGSGTDLRGKDQPEDSTWNIRGGDYSEKLIRRYYGKLPIFDYRDIVSTHADGKPCTFVKDGKTYRKLCPEYNRNKDMIHPNAPEIVDRIGKGFLIFLTKMYCPDKIPADRVTPKPEILREEAGAGPEEDAN